MYIIAADYDGTINVNGVVSDEDKAAIKRFREAGNQFGVVTGRIVPWAIEAASTVEHDFIVAGSGGAILNSENKIIAEKAISNDCVEKLMALMYKAGAKNLYAGNRYEVLGFDVSDAYEKGFALPENACIHQYCTWVGTVENALKMKEDIMSSELGKYLTVLTNGGSVDIPKANTGKHTGIEDYIKLAGETPDHVFAVGNEMNDYDMVIRYNGFAVSNAVQELKDAAKYQCNRIADMIDMIMNM